MRPNASGAGLIRLNLIYSDDQLHLREDCVQPLLHRPNYWGALHSTLFVRFVLGGNLRMGSQTLHANIHRSSNIV